MYQSKIVNRPESSNIAIMVVLLLLLVNCERSANLQSEHKMTTADVVANTLTDKERSEGWELLFDGATLNGWKRYNKDTIGPSWTVKNGMIICNAKTLGETPEDNGGSLLTVRHFENFELIVDWKISARGNSGILYHVVERPEYRHDYETGPEYQVLDDEGWKNDSLRSSQIAGSYYDMFAPSESNIVRPAGDWNSTKIVYNNGYVEHWLNGKKIVMLKEHDREFEVRYKKSKWPSYPGWNKFKTGSISLQEHGSPVYFRNIKIKVLNQARGDR